MRGFALAVVGVMLGLAACGDDSDEVAESFAADADAICVELAQDELQAYADNGAGAITVAYLSDTAELRAAAIERLAALAPPADDAAAYDEYLSALKRGLVVVDEAIDAVRADDVQSLARARLESREVRLEANEIGRTIGLLECAGVLSDEAAAAITTTLELSIDPSAADRLCREYATTAFVEGRFGSVEECVEQQGVETGVDEVEVEEMQGVEGVSANVLIALAGADSSAEFEASLAFEDGVWKLNSIAPTSVRG